MPPSRPAPACNSNNLRSFYRVEKASGGTAPDAGHSRSPALASRVGPRAGASAMKMRLLPDLAFDPSVSHYRPTMRKRRSSLRDSIGSSTRSVTPHPSMAEPQDRARSSAAARVISWWLCATPAGAGSGIDPATGLSGRIAPAASRLTFIQDFLTSTVP